MAITKDQVMEKLRTVNDPELRIDMVSLGLVYQVKIDEAINDIFVQVTLTTPGCPLIDYFMHDIHATLKTLADVGNVKVQLVFDPPWKPSMMSEEAKAELGIEE
ncbi:MAG: hypothetical protein A2898_02360 [Candidatus Kerfeldbacteria bacterium RIFCSPLOWO2_01_FULL_48_11]|uniref:MIP18 family-like domain-containing protein n=1 Tax=Candidatus Kerfeldbacteria bacterium RIFCSPLOWO2_01_FULL_48_11 TaxID=1798543 RepID=A0A1G2B4F9_9BACT|nr:MAG: hypothetical protein UY34_C0021G0014 [Parcubacteria group bacterium GW2011_GWA2_48_9]OGY83100.1 MAG: hypothetical protein A2898_02360 [Candidatus Kerfeldbacteria bacterium RIFCSPLOWO2_01_FULL_48_11]HCM68624.1 aromatic ring hydroxylase [Candidatus Kerfeldbacteria bacterium]